MGFAPTWLRQVSPPASQNHFNHWPIGWAEHTVIKNVVIGPTGEFYGLIAVTAAAKVRKNIYIYC